MRSGNVNAGIRVEESPYRETTPEETVDVFNTIMQINLHLRQEEEDKKGSKWEAFFV